MKVIAINGSPHSNGNTAMVLGVMLRELESAGVETECAHIGGERIHGCIGCRQCFRSPESACVFNDDPVNEVTAKMRAADGFILGSPTYFGGIAGTMKCFLDRAFYTSIGGKFRNKAAAVAVVARRSGGVEVVNQLKHYLTLTETIIAPSQYWQLVHGASPGEAAQDAEGVQIVRRNAQGLLWVLNMIHDTKDSLTPPQEENRAWTNFIRS